MFTSNTLLIPVGGGYSDLIPRFARDAPQICFISNMVMDHTYNEHQTLLEELNQPWLSRENLVSFLMIGNRPESPQS